MTEAKKIDPTVMFFANMFHALSGLMNATEEGKPEKIAFWMSKVKGVYEIGKEAGIVDEFLAVRQEMIG